MKTSELKRPEREALLNSVPPEFSSFAELGQRIGVDNLREVFNVLSGEKKHCPEEAAFYRKIQTHHRDERIRTRYQGGNTGQLALEFDLSPTRIKAIVNATPKKPKNPSPARHNAVKIAGDIHQKLTEVGLARGYSVRQLTDECLIFALNHPQFIDSLSPERPQDRPEPDLAAKWLGLPAPAPQEAACDA